MKRILFCLAALLLFSHMSALADLRLPDSLRYIEEEAFLGDASIDRVILGKQVLKIGPRAFRESGLKAIYLPPSLTEIADDAFEGPETVSVTANNGTYAYGWAVRNGYIRESRGLLSVSAWPLWVNLGNTVTWTAEPADADPSYEYAFTVYRGLEVVASYDYGPSNTLDYVPDAAGLYQVRVDVRSRTGETDYCVGGDIEAANYTAMSVDAVDEALGPQIRAITAPYVEDGVIDDSKVDPDIPGRAVFAWAESLKGQGIIRDCTYCKAGASVTFYMNDGTLSLYSPAIRDSYSAGPEYGVACFEALSTFENVIITQVEGRLLDYAALHAAAQVYLSVEEYTDFAYTPRSKCNLAGLKQFLQNISPDTRAIFWRGHGAYAGTEVNPTCVWLIVGPYTVDRASGEFANDWNDAAIAHQHTTGDSYDAISPVFFKKYMKSVKGGLFYCGACYSYQESMWNVIRDKGFDAYAGAVGSVFTLYGDGLMRDVAKYLCTKDGDLYMTFEDALRKAKVANLTIPREASIYRIEFGDEPFRLVPELATLKFVINDSDGLPIEGAQIWVFNTDSTYDQCYGYDSSKKWQDEIRVPKPEWGVNQLVITAEHFETLFEPIEVNGSMPLARVLKLLGVCSGTVTDADTGKPLAGVSVTATSLRTGETCAAATDAEGRYSLTPLDCGEWTIRFSMAGYEDGTAGVTLSARDWQRQASVSLWPKRDRIDLYPYLRTSMLSMADEFDMWEVQPSDEVGNWELTYKNKCFSITLSNESSMVYPTPVETIYIFSDPEERYCIDGFTLGMTRSEVEKRLVGMPWKKDYTGTYNGMTNVIYVNGPYSIQFYYKKNIVVAMDTSYAPWDDV